MSEHKEIWLAPDCLCHTSDEQGRCWAEDRPWEMCEGCDAKPVRYVLAPEETAHD